MALKDLLKAVNNKKEEQASYEGKFLKVWERALVKHEMEHQQIIPSDYFRPSSLAGCKRMLYYMRAGAEAKKDRDVALIGICDSGTDRHTRIQNIVAKMEGITILDIEEVVKEAKREGRADSEFVKWNSDHTEARCKNNELHVYFQPDGAFRFEGKECLLEVKTESTYQFNMRVAPKLDHIIQATTYAMGLGMDWILFFYEDRNFTRHKLYLVQVTEAMRQVVRDKVNDTEDYVQRKELPPKEEDKCTYCNYEVLCKNDINPMVSHPE